MDRRHLFAEAGMIARLHAQDADAEDLLVQAVREAERFGTRRRAGPDRAESTGAARPSATAVSEDEAAL